ncbi:MAG: hypothetical protein IBX46_06545 [Desulfuromonadales bacterium]|nr:hypothetical protein [Desulfuromonadales bacterium]
MIPFRFLLHVIVILLAVVLSNSSAHALIAAHKDYDGCSTCHDLHGAGTGTALLAGINTESTCLACHGPLGIANEAAIHNPLGLTPEQQGYVTCRECHGAHDNFGGNVKMVGYNWDPEKNINLDADKIPGIRVELSTTDPVAPPVYLPVKFTGSTDFNIDNKIGGRGACEICHSPFHNQGNNCTISCHKHDTGFSAAGGCTGCHDGTGVEALAVGPDSPHSETATGYTCAGCHSGHGDAGTIEIPNNTAVGIYYVANGETGISLGSSTVPGATEAEICWNCHVVEGVSEWGANTQVSTGNSTYNYGSLDQPNWTTAIWSSANFSYKSGAIQSTHAVDGLATAPGLDPVAAIRCSYCHDVHELALAPGDTKAGKPYLRGSWKGNPYKEDGAPSNTAGGKPGDVANYSAYDVTGKFGAVPRGGTSYTALGGYFIDQNSGSPTTNATMDSPDEFAGLCRLCHEGTAGTAGDGIWQAAEINTLNTFGTASADWVGNNNGHAAVVKGGSGVGTVNIFTTAKRHQTPWSVYTSHGTPGGNPIMAYRNARSYNSKTKVWVNTYYGQGLRGTDSTAFQYSPRVDTATRQYNYQHYNWGATIVVEGAGTMSDSGIDTNFHQFTCSKCHSPHASRLPRLLITNCLDTEHNTWDDAYVTPASDTNGSSSSLSLENRSVSMSQVTSAQNCHRLADPAYPQARPQGTTTGGWNRVSPW